MSKVYDCFLFYNELDLLEVRLKYYAPYVDYFVIVESPFTFSGQKKPLYFEQNKDRFKDFENQIIYKKYEGEVNKEDFWQNEYGQRKCLFEAVDYQPDDIIFLSDVDELFDCSVVLKYDFSESRMRIKQWHANFFINYFADFVWEMATVGYYKHWQNFNGSRDSLLKLDSTEEICGIHFSYLFGSNWQSYADKILSISHKELQKREFIEAEAIKGRFFYNLDLFDRRIRYHVEENISPGLKMLWDLMAEVFGDDIVIDKDKFNVSPSLLNKSFKLQTRLLSKPNWIYVNYYRLRNRFIRMGVLR